MVTPRVSSVPFSPGVRKAMIAGDGGVRTLLGLPGVLVPFPPAVDGRAGKKACGGNVKVRPAVDGRDGLVMTLGRAPGVDMGAAEVGRFVGGSRCCSTMPLSGRPYSGKLAGVLCENASVGGGQWRKGAKS